MPQDEGAREGSVDPLAVPPEEPGMISVDIAGLSYQFAKTFVLIFPVYVLGYLGLSFSWLLLALIFLMCFRKNKGSKSSRLQRALAFLENEEKSIKHSITTAELPASVNFFLFISIIRILLQKLRSPDVGGNDQSQFKRLTKSTLLLIPLFGVHYMVFAVYPMSSFSECQIWFELCIGSFQGLVVAILYCFLNTEVQGELKRKWGSLYLNRYINRDYRLHSLSISRNGSECVSQFKRNSRAPSIMQTETSVI